MGSGSKVALVCLRIWQLICSVIVVGILAAFVNRVANGDGPRDGRIIYALVTACLSSAFSIIFIAPFMYSFYAVPGDFILWIMWLVAFCLLDTRTGVHTCSAPWFTNYWGFYWGRRWRRPFFVPVSSGAGCAQWRTALAFCFMAMFAFLVSTIVAAVVVSDHWKKKKKRQEPMVVSGMRDTETSQLAAPMETGHPWQTVGEADNARRAGIGQPLTSP